MRREAALMMAVISMLLGVTPMVMPSVGGDRLRPLLVIMQIPQAVAQEKKCVEDWERMVVRVTGKGVAPFARFQVRAQAKIMAAEAGRAMAYGRLCDCIAGVRVNSGITVKDGLPDPQRLAKFCEAFIQGARIVGEEVELDAEAATGVVTLEIPLQGEQGLGGQLPPNLRPTSPQPLPSQETRRDPPSSPATSVIDGLILDAQGLPAQPTLYPQVLAEGGRVVYDWHGVDPEHRMLVGRVTNTVEKAAALLKKQGAVQPLVRKVARMEGPGTYVISAGDAKTVISADLESPFLRKSRVVFVLGF